MELKRISFGVAGGGTAGLVAAIMLRQAFPQSDITLIASSRIGIIGVGEGSTEHWKKFITRCEIPLLEMIASTEATHKYGIRFEGWSNAFPDYFHSVSGDEGIYAWGLYPTYMGFIAEGQALTSQTGSAGLLQDKIRRENLHENTNQYHFDTFALNRYLTHVAARRNVKFVDADISSVNVDPATGVITTVNLDGALPVEADFWIDATGFNRILSREVGNDEWNSFSKYLLTNAAIAFPTESDPNGRIRSYTRARALTAGWAWEIPTQTRRGNGYVYCDEFLDEAGAEDEISELLGERISARRAFKFDAGHLVTPWVKNVCAVGLSAAFVEPLEATSIGSTIQQMELLIPFVGSYAPTFTASQKSYNKSFNIMMDNILTMIRLHYVSDRNDTPFWQAMAEMPINDSLQELLDLWQETTLSRFHIGTSNGEMFLVAHLLHVAQGQGVINVEPIGRALHNFCVGEAVRNEMSAMRHRRIASELVDHAEALREVQQDS